MCAMLCVPTQPVPTDACTLSAMAAAKCLSVGGCCSAGSCGFGMICSMKPKPVGDGKQAAQANVISHAFTSATGDTDTQGDATLFHAFDAATQHKIYRMGLTRFERKFATSFPLWSAGSVMVTTPVPTPAPLQPTPAPTDKPTPTPTTHSTSWASNHGQKNQQYGQHGK